MLLFRGLIIIAIIINLIIIKNLTVTIIIATIIKSILCKLSHSNKFYSLNSNFSPSYINLPNSYITENLLWFRKWIHVLFNFLPFALPFPNFHSHQNNFPLKNFWGVYRDSLGMKGGRKGFQCLHYLVG